ncbi:MAG: hypothetical protein GY795_04040 [Desulfobacterales bacterium]|nr:hypothetical protein [Desulfobacterales bacterium]
MGANDRYRINDKDYKDDLPDLRTDDLDLPVLVSEKPCHEPPREKKYPDWLNMTSQQHVTSLTTDPNQGDLWLATAGGILRWRFDPDRFTRFTSEHGLPGNFISAIAADASGRIWAAGKNSGLYYLDNDTWCFCQALNKTHIHGLAIDQSGLLWIATDKNLYAVENIHDDPIIELPSPGSFTRKISVTDKSDIWLCNAAGLHHFNGTDWERPVKYTQPGILTLLHTGDSLWVGMTDGLYRMDFATFKPERIENTGAEVTAIAPAPNGIWASCGGMVGLATEKGWNQFSHVQDTRQVITALANAQKEDEVWIATHNGLMHGKKDRIQYHLTNSPPDVFGLADSKRAPATFSNMVQSLKIQRTENRAIVWTGTARGVFYLDLKTYTWKHTLHGIHDIRALATGDKPDEIRAASWLNGIYKMKDQKPFQELSSPITALAEGSGATRWAAGPDTLWEYNGEAWNIVIAPDRILTDGWIKTLVQIPGKNLWIGTSAGLFAYLPGADSLTQPENHIRNADIRCMAVQDVNSEQLWIGTDKGLFFGHPETPESVAGFEHEMLTALSWDKDNEILWAGTHQGLVQVIKNSNEWEISKKLTAMDSGLASDHVTVLELDHEEPGKRNLWIGTPCGLSCYTYQG